MRGRLLMFYSLIKEESSQSTEVTLVFEEQSLHLSSAPEVYRVC